MNDIVRKIMKEFKGSFINYNNELILIPKTNLYFRLDDTENDLDIICKLLEWCSRDACKSMPYHQQWRNDKYNNDVLNHINNVLETSFTHKEMDQIYSKLGNCCNHNLTVRFILNNYDMRVFEDSKQ